MGESGGASGWFEAERKRPKDQIVGALPTVSDGVDEKSRLEQMKKSKEAREALAQQIASAPTGYHASLPRLSDLDITHNWDKLLETIHREFDMSCLTACLARELDEDITWNPDMLLVQLTSDLMDAAELKNDGPGGNGFATDDDVAIGMMSGGEVVRKRREKGAISPEPADGNGNAAGGAAAPPASKRISLATAADGGGGGNAAVPSAPRKGIPGKPSSPAAKKASPAPQNSAARPSVSAKPNANATPRQGAAAVGPSKSPSKAAKKE